MELASKIAATEYKIRRLYEGTRIKHYVAQKFIAESAWWYGHPQGPVQAPNHLENIEAGAHGWQIAFGANKFLVERAIGLCVSNIRISIHNIGVSNQKSHSTLLMESLSNSIRGSVSNYIDEIYGAFWPIDEKGHMHFGSQSIHIPSFVDVLWENLALEAITE